VLCCADIGSCVAPETAADGTQHSQLLAMHVEADSNHITQRTVRDTPKPYLCTVCGKRFTRMHNLTAHGKSHDGEHRYECTECEKCFSFRTSLTQHLNVHTGKYKCVECGKCFPSNATLTKHRHRHLEETPYACTVCSERFTTSRGLNLHKRVHRAQKPHRQRVCDDLSNGSASLNNHIRVHTGVKPYRKPYSCLQCNKRFCKAGSLRKHQCNVRAEFNRRSHRCLYCRKLFKTKRGLACHIRAHTDDKRYFCKHCSDCFRWPGQLRQHMLKSHKEGILYPCVTAVRKFLLQL